MKTKCKLAGCGRWGLNRRQFLARGCAACAGAAGMWAMPARASVNRNPERVRIRIVYALHAEIQDRPDWPNVGFEFRPVMEKIESALTTEFPDFEFIPSQANGPEQAKAILASDRTGNIDGYLVYQMNCWNRVVQTLAESGKPVLYAVWRAKRKWSKTGGLKFLFLQLEYSSNSP